MLEKIKEILKDYTDAPITEQSAIIDDLELDSFTMVYFLTEIEDGFGIDIDETEFTCFVTIGDVMERIRKAQGSSDTTAR